MIFPRIGIVVPSTSRSYQARNITIFGRHYGFGKILSARTNKFRIERAQVLGPDFACLEWLMENGVTSVLMSNGTRITSRRRMKKFLKNQGFKDLEFLPKPTEPRITELRTTEMANIIENDVAYNSRWPNANPIFISEIDATDSAISSEGFKYFRECRNLRKLLLNYCEYYDDYSMQLLSSGRARKTLQELEIVSNGFVSDGIMRWLAELKALKRLHLYHLNSVVNRSHVLRQLQLALPTCKVTFPETISFGYGY